LRTTGAPLGPMGTVIGSLPKGISVLVSGEIMVRPPVPMEKVEDEMVIGAPPLIKVVPGWTMTPPVGSTEMTVGPMVMTGRVGLAARLAAGLVARCWPVTTSCGSWCNGPGVLLGSGLPGLSEFDGDIHGFCGLLGGRSCGSLDGGACGSLGGGACGVLRGGSCGALGSGSCGKLGEGFCGVLESDSCGSTGTRVLVGR
jgi:hypothetical protein